VPAVTAADDDVACSARVAGRFLVILVAVAAVLWMASQVKVVTTAAVLGFAAVSMLWPAVRWLRAHRVPAALASIVTVLAFLTVFSRGPTRCWRGWAAGCSRG
jgi:predicted PurR-regulated permease PerM